VLVASAVTDSLVGIGLELVWMMAVIDVAAAHRTAQYVAIGATLAGVRGVAGPLVGGLVIHAFGVHMVYLIAAILTFSGAWCVTRELASFARFRPGPGRGVYFTP
jgi:MFS family permease